MDLYLTGVSCLNSIVSYAQDKITALSLRDCLRIFKQLALR
jgi:hypothetical protein